MNRRRFEKGFTLIEVLIAMTLLGVMTVLLFSSLKIAAESWEAGENKITEVNKKAVVYQFFKQHLTSIRPVYIQNRPSFGESGVFVPSFQGLPGAVKFVGALPASAARKGLQLFEIAPDPDQRSKLTVSLTPYMQTAVSQPDRAILLDHIQALSFSYFGKKEDTGQALWYSDWQNLDRLPQLIKISISLDDGSYWPDMVIPVKITGLASPVSSAVINNN